MPISVSNSSPSVSYPVLYTKNCDLSKEPLARVAETVLVSEDKLKEMIKTKTEAEVMTYVAKKYVKYQDVLEEAKKEYTKIIQNYDEVVDQGGEKVLKAKEQFPESKHAPKVTKDVLFKGIRKTLLALKKESLEDQGVTAQSKKMGLHFIAVKEEGELHVALWSGTSTPQEGTKEYVASGGFGTVQRAYDLTHARVAALKISKTYEEFFREGYQDHDCVHLEEEARFQLENEVEKLRAIGDFEGLQAKPTAQFRIENGSEQKPINAYLGKYYNMRRREHLFMIKLTSSQRLTHALKILQAIETIQTPTKERAPIVHEDIKFDNIFVNLKKLKSYDYEVVLGDFGSAKYLDENTARELTYTPGHLTSTDFLELETSFDQGQFNDYDKKRDTFATATGLWELLTGTAPYEVNEEDGTADTSSPIKKMGFFKEHYGEALAAMFTKALNEDPDLRPSIGELITATKAAITEKADVIRAFSII